MTRTKMWVIEENSFKDNLNIEEKMEFLIRYAVLAPNTHNTQPWKFKITKNIVSIYPDFSKKLKVADKMARELWISLGCALENLLIAGQNFGFKHSIKYSKNKIEVKFIKSKTKKNKLFEFITKRVTNRRKSKKIKLSNKEINELRKIKYKQGVNSYLLDTKKDLNELKKLIFKSNNIFLSNEKYKEELLDWIKFNDDEIKKTNDGVSYKSMDMPSIPKRIGKWIMGYFLKPSFVNKEDEKKINNSSGVVLITTSRDDEKSWIRAGRTMERLLLTLTSLNIDYSFMNKACEIEETRNELKKITKQFPQIILRIGHSKPVAHSPRKDLGQNIINKS